MSDTIAPNLARLRSAFSGEILTAEDARFGSLHPTFNGRFSDHGPDVLARCADVDDVQRALAFAREAGLPLAIRSSGHSYHGESVTKGGVQLDLRPMNAVSVDPEARTATVAGGANWRQLDGQAASYGLATTGGLISTTGVGGLTVGGGIGRIMRKHGLSCDNVIAFEVVTAEGERLRVDAESHADLNWALRGGGGNYGVVTEFEFRLHPIEPIVLSAAFGWPAEAADDAFAVCRPLLEAAPRELWCQALFCTAPEAEYVPPQLRGKPALIMNLGWAGDLAAGEKWLEGCQEGAAFGGITRSSYVDLQQSMDEFVTSGRRAEMAGGYVKGLDSAHLETVARSIAAAPSDSCLIELVMMGGAIADVEPEASAFSGRDADWMFGAAAFWTDAADDEHSAQWCRDLKSSVGPTANHGGSYLSMTRSSADARSSMPEAMYDRLATVKRAYDPTEAFGFKVVPK